MKILFDARWIKPKSPDGITRYSRELIRILQKSKDIGLWLLISDRTQLAGLLDAEYILTNKPTSPKEINQSRRLNSHNFDAVYSPHYVFGGNGREFALVRTVHDLIPFMYPTTKAKIIWKIFHTNTKFLKFILNNSEGITVVSKTTKDQVSKLTDKPIEIIYNAPFIKGVKNTGAKRELLYIGRFERYKYVEMLIEAISMIPDYKLLLAGNCGRERKEQLLNLAKNKDQVVFLGKISDEDYTKKLSEISALVSASMMEGFGLPIVESMAAGCPVVCSNIKIHREVAGKAGLFFDLGDPNEFIKCIKKLENNDFRQKISALCEKQAQKYSWQKSADKLKSFLLSFAKND